MLKFRRIIHPSSCPYCGTIDPRITSKKGLSWLTLQLLRYVRCGICTTLYYQPFWCPVKKRDQVTEASKPVEVTRPARRIRRRRKLVSYNLNLSHSTVDVN